MWQSFDINDTPEIANAMLTVNSMETPTMPFTWDYGTPVEGATAHTTGAVNIRKEADTSAQVLGTLNNGDVVTYWSNVSPTANDGHKWWKIRKGTIEGFCAATYITSFTTPAPPTGEYLTYARADIDAIYAILAKGQPSSGGGTF